MRNPSTRRMYRRVERECHACILTSSAIHRCMVRDLSLSGFRVKRQGKDALSLHMPVMIRVWLPGVSVPIDIDQAIVRWDRGNEFGVEIQSISNGSDFQLAGFIERTLQSSIGCDEAPGQAVG
ncbi:MAG: PilZ domain-containing protein [Nitrospirota bacterium]